MTKISITTVPTYQQQLVNEAVKTHFERFHIDRQITPDTKVLLKPNLLMKRSPEEFTTTHPSIIEAVIIWLEGIGVRHITIADSPGGPYTAGALRGIYQVCGLSEVCSRHHVILNLDTSSRQTPSKNGRIVSSFPLIGPICDADFIIDLCKLKTHAMTGLSGAVKNLFGAVPGLSKPNYHAQFPKITNFSSMLVDLCETVSPHFIIVDAIHSMEGNGPSGGTKRESGLIVASDNPYELDYFLCHLIGADPLKVLTVKESISRGLCRGNLDELNVIGEYTKLKPFLLPKQAAADFSASLPKILRRPMKAFINSFVAAKPKILFEKCIGCGKCAESCPVKTIHIKDKKAVIKYHDCIRCFCCHEMCPVRAIEIRR